MREVVRTPSPTPSEARELARTSLFDFKAMMNWKYWIRREWLWYYVIGTACLIFVILFTVFHKKIVHWLHPAAVWMHDLPAGWLIPIAIFFVISFPPLFGHEILAILCGLVWGLWAGFGITAAGTFIGEIGNFYAFRYVCSARGEKLEKNKLQYAYLARVVRDGGFRIALIARFSAIPGHFTTAVFSTCGMGIWTFSLAALLSLPKQFMTVYLGVALEQSESGDKSTSDKIIQALVIGITTIVTIGAMWYVYHKMNLVKPIVIYERRKARQAKLNGTSGSTPFGDATQLENGSEIFNPNASNTNLPLNPRHDDGFQHQQWDAEGRAVGYSGDPTLYAPQPKRPTKLPSSLPESRSGTPGAGPSQSGPMMSEVGRRPIRQDTASSAGSWNPNQGQPNACPMSSRRDVPRIPPPPASPLSSAPNVLPHQSQTMGKGPGSSTYPLQQPNPHLPPPPYIQSFAAQQQLPPQSPSFSSSSYPQSQPQSPGMTNPHSGPTYPSYSSQTPTQAHFTPVPGVSLSTANLPPPQIAPMSPISPMSTGVGVSGHVPSSLAPAGGRPRVPEASEASYMTAQSSFAAGGAERRGTMTEDAYTAYDYDSAEYQRQMQQHSQRF
ncbi:hypothetical protein K474DRAFT_1595263 [Panus rudis PR-1116 ss-1]|nr:hypothetical protein K474DRAFT_1595263 [Panus rudis PR-1116 ss-1]